LVALLTWNAVALGKEGRLLGMYKIAWNVKMLRLALDLREILVMIC
jgi:hypothetical protein